MLYLSGMRVMMFQLPGFYCMNLADSDLRTAMVQMALTSMCWLEF